MSRPTDSAISHHLLREHALSQGGVISRKQVLGLGWSDGELQAQVDGGRWTVVHPGIYWLSNGPLTREAVRWGALLWAGPDSALGLQSAPECQGLHMARSPFDPVTVLIPWERRVAGRPGIIIRRRRHLQRQIHRHTPPLTRIEHTVLDLASEADTVRDAVGWITRAYQRKLTTRHRLDHALHSRVRLPRRRLLMALVASVSPGSESPLEHDFDRTVVRHGLPAPERQERGYQRTDEGATRLIRRDRRFGTYNTVVELDGRIYHEDAWAEFRDMDRDNATEEADLRHLRYGPADVYGRPCAVARQLGRVLATNGWTGEIRRCGPDCTALG